MAKTKNVPQKTSKKEKMKMSNKKLGAASGGVARDLLYKNADKDAADLT